MKHLSTLAILLLLCAACSKAEPAKTQADDSSAKVTPAVMPAAPAPTPPPAPTLPTEPPKPSSMWEVATQVDPMTDEVQVIARAMSIEPVAGSFGRDQAALIVRCANRRLDVYVAVPNMLDYDGMTETTRGRYRFGTSEAVPIAWQVSTDRQGAFFTKPAGWVKILQNNEHEVVTFQLPAFRDPTMFAKFSLAGAKADLQRVLDACP
jgi:hypothetical protein